MKPIAVVAGGEVRLDSLMDEMSFGKTDYDSVVTRQGLFASAEKNGKEYSFTFNPWTFSTIRTIDTEDGSAHVFYCGDGKMLSPSAMTLQEYFVAAGTENSSVKDRNRMSEASFALCSALTSCASGGRPVPQVGAGGILVDFDGDCVAGILFLPADIFRFASGGLDAVDRADALGCWQNSSLSDLPALCFFRSVVAYRMLTGRFPYPAADDTERNADILDGKFLPLDYSVNGIDGNLAAAVNRGLLLNANSVAVPGKKRRGRSSGELSPEPSFPLGQLELARSGVARKTALSDEEFARRAELYLRRKASAVSARRKFRRNSTAIAVCLVVALVLGLITTNVVKSNGEELCSAGLDSVQTVRAFFEGVNAKDVQLLGNITKGKNAGGYVDTIGQIYVIGKSREVYSRETGFLSPETYLLSALDEAAAKKCGVYGVTNLLIDGKAPSGPLVVHAKNESVAPVTSEQGISLSDGDRSVHSAEYYLVHSEGDDNGIFVEKFRDTFTLTYIRDRWIITDITTSEIPVGKGADGFLEDYFSVLAGGEYAPVRALRLLSGKYPWIPSSEVLEEEQRRIDARAANPFSF